MQIGWVQIPGYFWEQTFPSFPSMNLRRCEREPLEQDWCSLQVTEECLSHHPTAYQQNTWGYVEDTYRCLRSACQTSQAHSCFEGLVAHDPLGSMGQIPTSWETGALVRREQHEGQLEEDFHGFLGQLQKGRWSASCSSRVIWFGGLHTLLHTWRRR